MRLPFGFGRRSSSGNGAGGGSPITGSGSSASAPGGAAARPSRAWASLPPIQRTTGEMPLVAAPGSFVEGLPGATALPPMVQPLGHEVSSLATPGLVVAHARPVAAPTGGALPAPVQRRATRAVRPEAASAPAAIAEPEVDDSSWAASSPSPAVDHDMPAPIRSLPTVSRQTIRIPDRPLTSAASAARPASVQRAAAGASERAVPTPAPGGMRRVPSSLPSPRPTVSRLPLTSPAPSVATTPTAAPQPARSGLGAPVDALPSSARPIGAVPTGASPVIPVSRSIATPMPLASAGRRTSLQRDAAEGAPSGTPSDAAPAAIAAVADIRPAASAAPLPELPILAVSRSTRPSSIAAPAPVTAKSPSTPLVRPILGARPIEPTIRVQRAAAPDDDDGDDGEGLPSPWWAPPASPDTSPAIGGTGGVDAGGFVVSRSVPGYSTPDRPAQPRPASSTGSASASARTSVAGRSVQRASAFAPALPLARPAIAASNQAIGRQASAPVESSALVPIPQRSIVGPSAEVVVQTSPASAASAPARPSPASVTSPVVQRAESESSPINRTDATKRSDTDLEELAQALFSRIRGRLRSELIHDREAKGLTFDNV